MRIVIGETKFDVVAGANDWFWQRVNQGNWEPETFRVFTERLTPETVVLDIGAWIGATALYCAQLAKRVIAYEPDPVAYAELCRNIAANPHITNIQPVNAAVSDKAGVLKLGIRDKPGDSSSSVLFAGKDGWEVESLPLRDVVAAAGASPFIKMDVEGHEFALARQLADVVRRHNATAFVALHPHIPGAARAARIGRRTPLHKLARSVVKRTVGRYDGYRVARTLARDLDSQVRVFDPEGAAIDLERAARRVLVGKNITDSGAIVITP